MSTNMNSVAAAMEQASTTIEVMASSVEANRAGESGKGFTVIANEIKALAKQTAVATYEIKQMVSKIQARPQRPSPKVGLVLICNHFIRHKPMAH